ncbi:MAG: Ppx/GppA phosphatase family protein [Mariprofundaceae bacterium]
MQYATQRIAAIDVGSNTVRLLIADSRDKKLLYRHTMTRLAEGLHASGHLRQDAMERTAVALRRFSELIRQFDVHYIRVVATAAVREAGNGVDFIRMVETRTGLCIEVIDGAQEASLSVAGASAVLSEAVRSDMLLFDVGGGSTEFIRVQGSHTQTCSHKLGVVRLIEALPPHDPPKPDDYQAMVQRAAVTLEKVEHGWQGQQSLPSYLVGTAGTVTTIAALHMQLGHYDAERVNNHVIPVDDLWDMRDHVCSLSHAERASIPAIELGRCDLILAGFAIVEAMMSRWHYDQLISVDAGLLEGCVEGGGSA